MKKVVSVLTIMVLLLTCFVSCNSDVDEKIFEKKPVVVDHQHYYKLLSDGSWQCTIDPCTYVLEGTESPYITVVKNGQPTEIIPLTSSRAVGVGKITVSGTNITYENTSGTAQNVVIRTNGGELKLDAANDKVKFYGNVKVIDVDHISSTSLWMYGSANMVNMSNGRLVITNAPEAAVGTIFLSATEQNYNNIILATQNGAELPEIIAREEVTLPGSSEKKIIATVQDVDGEGAVQGQEEHIYLYGKQTSYEEVKGYENVSDMGTLILEAPVGAPGGSFTIKVKDGAGTKDVEVKYDELPAEVKEEKVASVEEVKAAATDFAGGKGTKSSPWLIDSLETFNHIANHDEEYHYYKIKDGITELDFSAYKGQDFLYGSLDGNNVKILNLSTMLFGEVGNNYGDDKSNRSAADDDVVIENLNIEFFEDSGMGSWLTALVGNIAVNNMTFKNVNISGYLEGDTISSYSYGHCANTTAGKRVVNFIDCTSKLDLVATANGAAGFISHELYTETVNLVNSKFIGTISKGSGCVAHYIGYHHGYLNTTVNDDNPNKEYNNSDDYTAEGKVASFSKTSGVMPDNIGDVFVLENVADNASYAKISILIAPNEPNYAGSGKEGGFFQSTYDGETVDVINGKVTSSKIKYFGVRINEAGQTQTGIHGDYFDVVDTRYGKTHGNTVVSIATYTAEGALVSVVTYNFNDSTTPN